MVVTAVVVKMVTTNVAMVKEIVIQTMSVPAVLFVEKITVDNLVIDLIAVMTAVCSGTTLCQVFKDSSTKAHQLISAGIS